MKKIWEKIKNYFKGKKKSDIWVLSLFYRGNDFQPPYMWVSILMTLTCTGLYMVYTMYDTVPVAIIEVWVQLILGTFAFVSIWLTIYNWDRKNQANVKASSQEESANPIPGAIKEVAGKFIKAGKK